VALLETMHIEGHDYSFKQLRHMLQNALGRMQEGVCAASDFLVTQRGAGANMSVDVGAGNAWVDMDTGTRNGTYFQHNDAAVNVAVGAAHATLPRVDQLVLQINDPNVTGVLDVAELKVLPGTPTAGAQISSPLGGSYRAGAAALGNDRIRLADILVPAAAATIVNANIVDRRQMADGAVAQRIGVTSSPFVTGASYLALAEMLITLDTGAPTVRVDFDLEAISSAGWVIGLHVDGVLQPAGAFERRMDQGGHMVDGLAGILTGLAAGRHVIEVRWLSLSGTVTAQNTRRKLLVNELTASAV
jgi:hypothetical protein